MKNQTVSCRSFNS